MKRLDRWWSWLGMAVLFGLGGLALFGWQATGDLLSPPRRSLQEHHLSWLKKPSVHGITVRSFVGLDGQVPCLLVTADKDFQPGARGMTLRAQLKQRGHLLPPHGTSRGTLLLFHGRNLRKEDLLPIAERFCAVGYRCLLPDLPAHGDSPLTMIRAGATDFEHQFSSALVEEARSRFDLPTEPLGVWGMSMGGAFAIRAAQALSHSCQAIVIVSSFDQLDQVIHTKLAGMVGSLAYPVKSALSQIVRLKGGFHPAAVRPADWANELTLPVMVAHGNQDKLIPIDSGRKLFDSFESDEKRFVTVEGGTHDNVLVTSMPLYAIMAEWFLKHLD